MKKTCLQLAICLCIIGGVMTQNTFAQKPADSKYSLETELNLAGTTITAPGIKLRYFMSETMAISLGFNYSSSKETSNYTDLTTEASGSYEVSSSGMGISPGVQFHMAGTDKLSPYVGFSISIGMGSANTDGTDVGLDSMGVMGYSADVSSSSEMPWSSFGWGLNAGADYYFAESFYAGVEFSLGGSTTTYKEGDISWTAGGTTITATTDESTSASMGVSATGGIRLGWRF
ncbi:MAG TPA: hypothetical protein EYN71_07560 [Flavobacteriales bacterium]|nr:hypothetical protein [Flavobacteriales bacterium]HIO68657.1 hypothetical protein [Flavobacteriales bacterium]